MKQLLGKGKAEKTPRAKHGVLAVAGINVAFGGDNIGVYTPLFAASPGHAIALYGAVFAVLTAARPGSSCWGWLDIRGARG